MITYNNTSKLIFAQGQDNNILNLKTKSKSTQGASDTDFKSVFDKTLSNTTKSSKQSNIAKNGKDISQNADSTVKYKSFRELQADKNVSSTSNSVEKTTESVKSQDVDLDTKELSNGSEDYDEAINVMAQMLGLQPHELVKMANDLGFSEEDLKDANKLSLFMDKLSSVLELNDSQKAMMNTLAAEVLKQVKTESTLEKVSTLEIPKNTGAEPKPEANTINDTKTFDISKIADEVKVKLNQLIQSATTNPETVGSEISKVIAAMKSQIQAKITTNHEQVATKDIVVDSTESLPNSEQLSAVNTTNVNESKKASNSAKEESAENTEKGDSTENSATKTVVDIKSVNTQISTSSDQNQQLDQQNEQMIGDIKIGISNSQAVVQKTEFTMPKTVKSSEVLNQVVEQAKVIIGQDKSEMVIQLKPDHLGKLELKVVTEQGIVAAKFIAESQQVKEIIETNMQLLKDSLQKQGISIDSINVQVGQDKQSEYQQQNSYQSKNNSSSNRQRYGGNEVGISKIGINAFDTLPERLAQYSTESNTINLTA